MVCVFEKEKIKFIIIDYDKYRKKTNDSSRTYKG
ncbi:hypothetical protein SAMN05444369_11926 [Capnocytophaga haemolytica]|uniref:Uncharacterized protein n=1 Tax=Capnocytophaga haemolytica TaxID=45243 RepID=A0AAX2GYD9_9FLAO|nr:hypothetical protein SAMN05444369_11926 [Capnocytophaga haemolytica]SNV11701.1 Uncharacterised protein [Capnocytophaga haemolytica]